MYRIICPFSAALSITLSISSIGLELESDHLVTTPNLLSSECPKSILTPVPVLLSFDIN